MSSGAYANGVYGSPQVAAHNNDNTIAMHQIRGGGGAAYQKDPNNSIHLGGGEKKRGGRVGLEQIIVPAGLMVANQWMRKGKMPSFKNKSSKRGRKTFRRRK